jgi:hypothetical protein
MCQTNLSWSGIPSSSDDTYCTGGVMNLPEWTIDYKRIIFTKQSGYWIYLWDFDYLTDFHIRQNTRECFGKHGFSRSWWSLHQYIMSSGSCYQKSSLGLFLSYNEWKIDIGIIGYIISKTCNIYIWHDFWVWFSNQYLYYLFKIIHWNDFNIRDQTRLSRIFFWYEYIFKSTFFGIDDCRQNRAYRPQFSIKCQFS